MPRKRKKLRPDKVNSFVPSNNFVKKYMDLLTKPATHRSAKDYDRADSKRNLKKELDRGN